jgi:hypothetical protein
MKCIRYLAAVAAVFLLASACNHPGGHALESFPYDLRKGQPVLLDFRSLDGSHGVGVVCSREQWSRIYRDRDKVQVRLLESKDPKAKVFREPLGTTGTVGDSIPDWHFLFQLVTTGRTKIELTLPQITESSPSDGTIVKIVAAQTPAQANAPW